MSTETILGGRFMTSLVLVLLLILTPPIQAGTWSHEGGTLTLDHAPERVVALNWAAAETLLLLGVTPVGVADMDGYSAWVKEPAMPESVYNVGSRSAPSLEAIAELEPDLIVTSGQLSPASNLLESIAPTYVISVYREGVEPFSQARQMLLTLGEMLDREARAETILTELEQTLAHQRTKLEEAGLTERPVALVSFMDDRHVRIYTPNGLFQATLERLGLDNAWPRNGNFWGFSVIGLESLAPHTDAHLVVIEPLLPGLADNLADSPFWNYLPPVQREQVYRIEPVWTFGGVYPVKRLATLLTDALLEGGSNNVR